MSLMDRTNRKAAVVVEPRQGEPVGEELAQLVAELETDERVRLMLDHAPEVPAPGPPALDGGRHPAPVANESLPPAMAREGGNGEGLPPVVYRDKDDVRTILNMTWVMMIMATLLVASGAGNVYQYYRRPDRIVVDGPSGRVLSINDRNYGREEAVEFGPEKLTDQDKLYATREFVRALYQIDPATRPRDIERALTMMVPDSAMRFAKWMREKGILDRQRGESWQTVWTPMDVSVDRNDPYTVNVIGKQEITRVENGRAVRETRQLRLTLKLVADNKGRADRNLRSGFLVSYLDYRELNEPANSPAAESPTGSTLRPAQSDDGRGIWTPVTALQDR